MKKLIYGELVVNPATGRLARLPPGLTACWNKAAPPPQDLDEEALTRLHSTLEDPSGDSQGVREGDH